MAAGGGKKTTTTKRKINKPDNKKPCECSLSGCDMTFYFPRQNKGSVPITSCLWSFASAETARQGHRAKSPHAVTSRKRDEAELPSQMAIKILGGALIQRRESGLGVSPLQEQSGGTRCRRRRRQSPRQRSDRWRTRLSEHLLVGREVLHTDVQN